MSSYSAPPNSPPLSSYERHSSCLREDRRRTRDQTAYRFERGQRKRHLPHNITLIHFFIFKRQDNIDSAVFWRVVHGTKIQRHRCRGSNQAVHVREQVVKLCMLKCNENTSFMFHWLCLIMWLTNMTRYSARLVNASVPECCWCQWVLVDTDCGREAKT